MQNSKNIKPFKFFIICVGFLMIATVCIVAKNKSLSDNKFPKEMMIPDSLKNTPEVKNILDIEVTQVDFPNEGKAWRLERRLTISY